MVIYPLDGVGGADRQGGVLTASLHPVHISVSLHGAACLCFKTFAFSHSKSVRV